MRSVSDRAGVSSASAGDDISEVFSPPRVSEEVKKYKLKPGMAMDLLTGWDFNRRDHRDQAKKYVQED